MENMLKTTFSESLKRKEIPLFKRKLLISGSLKRKEISLFKRKLLIIENILELR